jgi:hypothetical protein
MSASDWLAGEYQGTGKNAAGHYIAWHEKLERATASARS